MTQTTPPDEIPAELRELSHVHGVRTEFYGFDGTPVQVRASTLVAVLEALGVPATTRNQVQMSLALARDDEWRQALPPTVVVRQGIDATVPVHVTDGSTVQVWVELDGAEPLAARRGHRERRDLPQVEHYVEPRMVDGRRIGRATFAVPADLPLGWHTLHATSDGAEAKTTLVVTPQRLTLPPAVEQGQVWGLLVQLYSVRSRTSWGLGDLADLADIAWLAAHRGGADFVAINPLAAAEPTVPMTPSPYLPTSRRFLNPIYVRVEDILETAYLSAADRSLVEWAAEPVRDRATDPGPIDRDAVWEAKKAALEVVFTAPRRAARQAAYEEFVTEQGAGLRDFATWCAITEHLAGKDWPRELSTPDAPAVRALRERLRERVEFHMWLQWVADEQKTVAQRTAREAGMKIGIMHDLAVGVHPEGADAWANGAYLARGVEVGAPPDMYNQQGQNWSQPPWNPRALAKAGYAPYRDMLRTVLRSAGALRADHILGLFRLWWIPGGSKASAGTYVAYDHEAMVGILCLEAHRAGAVVVGEDLGVFEPWVRDYLADRGILGTSVMWFEQENGGPLPPEKYRHLTMASVGTHDMPPTAGYLAGEHVDLRERLGLLTEPVEVVRRRARAEREVFVRVLVERGLVREDASEREIVEAMHRYLRQTPSALFGVQLVDMVGERRSQNQPGTDQEYPNWKVPLGDANGNPILLEDLFDSQRLRSLIEALNA
ncbi:4-alpha-glucanotransferase [Xylanimonas cellulosilytica DSM 15894]|uniref:4-alpha-glucanotransferase n=1 Tax=Xylanimonas cellulosilytica (strain DSM 15894 / JCM 12276 / CECT 5975 / KCTC 9989 / LMG 20990 / NBRC 107835 / XIL07) TaxID=446471 RepID=D1BZH8_XYLCX|nr:4-alpha-glucanotransferase [Xylanimonas cellulosilytica]ACZ30132.1 4-alpha-glucanotransferase [Xylanimonas cellulosilytica DSM 15894]